MISHYYDEDTGILLLYGKGEGAITYLEVKDGGLKSANTYSGNDQQIGLSFFPKRCVDYNSCELARAAKLTKDSCYYVSFKQPRRNQGFSEEFYPDCTVGVPSMSVDEFMKGENKPLLRKKITEIENKFKSEPMNITKKVVEERKSRNVTDLEAENEELKKRIIELEDKLAEAQKQLSETKI